MWFKVDDKLHDHRKARRAGKSAMGVWVLAGSWSMDNETDGFIPDDVLARWGTRSDAAKLVSVGFWDVEEHQGEQGWRFHDWARFQPSAAVTAARRAKESEAAVRGNHKRWHVARGISDPDCEYCYRVPDGAPDQVPDEGGESAPNRPVPEPDPVVEANASTRPDVERLCNRLAERVEANGAKRPTVTKGWRDAARLLIDKDGRTEEQIAWLIDWATADSFWRSNILSMPKLREKFDQMLIRARPEVSNIRHLPSVADPNAWMRRRPGQ